MSKSRNLMLAKCVGKILVCCLLVALHPPVWAEDAPVRVLVELQADAVSVQIHTNSPVQHSLKTGAKETVVDIFPARLQTVFELTVDAGVVGRVRAESVNATTVRLTVTTLVPTRCGVSMGKNGSLTVVAPGVRREIVCGTDPDAEGEVVFACTGGAKFLSFLESLHPECAFLPHPAKRGFYVVGDARVVAKTIASLNSDLNKAPDPPGRPEREWFQIPDKP